MSRRRVRPEELEIWRQVARTARPLMRERPEGELTPPENLPEPPPRSPVPAHLPRFEIGQAARRGAPAHDILPGIATRLALAPVEMDRKKFERLRRGRLEPEARLDLHGLTLDRAHSALTGFILGAQASGKRLVLVITGKGRGGDAGGPIPVREGALRHAVPQWLRLPPLAPVVLQVAQAHRRHGGGGACYVYLRRQRQ